MATNPLLNLSPPVTLEQLQHLQNLLQRTQGVQPGVNTQLQAVGAGLTVPALSHPGLPALLAQQAQQAQQALPQAGGRPAAILQGPPASAAPAMRPPMAVGNNMLQQHQARPHVPQQVSYPYAQQQQQQQLFRPAYSQPGPSAQALPQYLQPRPSLGALAYRPQPGQAQSSVVVQAPQPLSEEDKRLVPKKSIARMAAAAGAPAGSLAPDAEAALMQLAEDWVTTALAFGCGAARRRRSTRLMPSDLALYLDSAWNLHVPGYGSDTVHPYKRSAVPELHRARAAVVRRTIAESSSKAAVGPTRAAPAPSVPP